MFNFFKKKQKTEKSEEKIVEVQNSDDIKSEIEHITIEIDELESADPITHDELSSLYEKRGICYSDLNEIDNAISDLEKSMKLKPSIGDSYKKLLNLYNKKRAQAAQAGNDDEIEYYMNKLDELRQIAKIGTVS